MNADVRPAPVPDLNNPTKEEQPIMSSPVEQSEQVPAPEPVDSGQQSEQVPEEATEPAGAEAAKYRRKLRAAEADLANLRERVDTLHRSEVERLARDRGIAPAAIWAGGAQLDTLRTTSGDIDPALVTAEADRVRELFYLGRPTPDPGQGPRPYSDTGSAWTAAFGPRRQR